MFDLQPGARMLIWLRGDLRAGTVGPAPQVLRRGPDGVDSPGCADAPEIDREGDIDRDIDRDVSPHNLLLSHDANVKVSDFGLAKVRDGRKVRSEPAWHRPRCRSAARCTGRARRTRPPRALRRPRGFGRRWSIGRTGTARGTPLRRVHTLRAYVRGCGQPLEVVGRRGVAWGLARHLRRRRGRRRGSRRYGSARVPVVVPVAMKVGSPGRCRRVIGPAPRSRDHRNAGPRRVGPGNAGSAP
jgi:hypothetical protein